MSLSNLRPDLTITQRFVNPNPIVPATNLPTLLIGLNRSLVYRATVDVGNWNGGSAVTGAELPGHQGGLVEAADAEDTELRPKVYVQGEFGTSEITSQVTFNGLSGGSPDIDIPEGVDAVFEIASGTAGRFAVNTSSPLSSSFTDTSADFIVDRVAPGDKIKINEIETFEVHSPVGIVSDTQLNVRRLDKGPSTAGASEAAKILLSAEDTNDVRVLTSTSSGFSDAGGFVNTGVSVGDLVRIDYWTVEEQGSGITFSSIGESVAAVGAYSVPATERAVTLPSSSGFTASPWQNSVYRGGVIFTSDENSDLRPAFYTTSSVSSDRVAVKDFATNHVLDNEDADFGVIYQGFEYTTRTSPSTAGSFSVATVVSPSGETRRTFSDTALILSPGNFESPGGGGPVIGDHISVKDSDGVYRPVFEILGYGSSINSPTSESPDSDGILVVKQFGSDIILPNLSATNVDYIVLNPGSPSEYLGASVGAAGSGSLNAVALSPDERLVSAASPYDFNSADAGDLVFSDTGTLMFVVSRVGTGVDSEKIAVRDHPNAGTVLDSPDTISAFGFSVRSSARSDFTVKRVSGATTLELTQLTTTPNVIPGTQSIKGAIYFQQAVDLASPENLGTWPALVTTGDSAANLAYTIEKTVSGADLEGTILMSYAEVLGDNAGTLVEVDSTNFDSALGSAVPGNPLALAARISLANTGTSVFTLQVASDTVAAWTTALTAAETDRVYALVPLTQREDILTLMRSHVATQSLPDNKRERIGYQSHLFSRQDTRTTLTDGDAPTVSRTSGGVQTVEVQRDLTTSPASVIIGDVFSGSFFDGSVVTAFSGSITDSSETGGVTTLTMAADGNVPVNTSDLVITDYTITSKNLTDAQLKDEAVTYTQSIASRRIRNIFPYTYSVNFTDDTSTADPNNEGFYGGGDVTDYSVGGEFVAAMEAGKRSNFGPARPLTKLNGAGIYDISDPFAGAPSLQDALINAGHYYMEQPGGLGAGLQAIRALTTDTTVDLNFAEDIVTTQVDSFARKLRAALRPILGAYVVDEGFFNIVSAVQGGVVKDVLDNRELRTAVLTSISEDEDTPDTFLLDYEVTPFFSGARGQVTIFI